MTSEFESANADLQFQKDWASQMGDTLTVETLGAEQDQLEEAYNAAADPLRQEIERLKAEYARREQDIQDQIDAEMARYEQEKAALDAQLEAARRREEMLNDAITNLEEQMLDDLGDFEIPELEDLPDLGNIPDIPMDDLGDLGDLGGLDDLGDLGDLGAMDDLGDFGAMDDFGMETPFQETPWGTDPGFGDDGLGGEEQLAQLLQQIISLLEAQPQEIAGLIKAGVVAGVGSADVIDLLDKIFAAHFDQFNQTLPDI
jgi:hypothetical protein